MKNLSCPFRRGNQERDHKRKSFNIKDLSYEFPCWSFFRLRQEKKRFNFCFPQFVTNFKIAFEKKGEEKNENHTNFPFAWKHIFIVLILENKLKIFFPNSSIMLYVFRLSFHTSWYTAHEKEREGKGFNIEKWCECLMCFLFPFSHIHMSRKYFKWIPSRQQILYCVSLRK